MTDRLCPFVDCEATMSGDELVGHIRAEHDAYRKLLDGTLGADEIAPVAEQEGSA